MKNSIFDKLKGSYKRQQFHPSFLGAFVNPFFLPRRALAEAISETEHHLVGRLLDVGCGTMPYREDFVHCEQYVGLEFDTPENRAAKHADYFYDGVTFPFENASFDSVICNEVLEHVFNPRQFVGEVQRVLKPGGSLLLTVPFIWDEHEQPYDYGRYSSYGLTHLLESSGFQIVHLKKTCSGLTGLFALLNAYIFKKTLTKNHYLNLLFVMVLMLPFNLLGLLGSLSGSKNGDLYLDNVALARKTGC